VELFLGIIATCAPCLKSLWDQFLRHMGIELSTGAKSQSKSQDLTWMSGKDNVKMSYLSRNATYDSQNEKDVIVKQTSVSWETAAA
jgi:hypothetical protein